MRVQVIFEIDDRDRRLLACIYGRHRRLATAQEVRDHFRVYGTGSGGDDSSWERAMRCEVCNPDDASQGAMSD